MIRLNLRFSLKILLSHSTRLASQWWEQKKKNQFRTCRRLQKDLWSRASRFGAVVFSTVHATARFGAVVLGFQGISIFDVFTLRSPRSKRCRCSVHLD